MPKATFRIETGANPERLKLRIEDAVSGTAIMSIELSPKQIFDLVRGGSFEVEGGLSDHLERLGKTMVHESHLMPSTLHQYVYGEALEPLAEEWARHTFPGWDVYHPARTNTGGVRVIVRKWVDQ